VVGSDEAEARQARHVTILGGAGAVSALVEQGLRMSGCQVQRIESDLAANLWKCVDEGKAY
jgi:putative cell wall-binding protein